MAQYYHVLSAENKSSEEETQFYSANLEDNQTVQYVIAPDQQQFQTQQVVVSSEQLMVVEGQPEVILDQSSVAYQTPYIIQDASGVELPNNRHHVYYMANTQRTQQIVVEQQQPVVLNHHLMQSQINKVAATTPIVQAGQVTPSVEKTAVQMQAPVRSTIKTQPRQQLMQRTVQMNAQQKVAGQAVVPVMQNPIKKGVVEKEMKDPELVTLADGTILSIDQYRKLITQQKQALQERLNSVPVPANAAPVCPKKMRTANVNRRSKAKARPVVNFAPQSPEDDQSQYNLQQNNVVSPQFQNSNQNMQVNRPQPPQPNRYLIQPPKPQAAKVPPKSLPSFLHSSQIQSIIENTPKNAEYSDSIRMLVLLENGEQRLITFTLPKEACTIQEILEQVNVPFQSDTPIQVTESNSNGLNYIVTVGNVPGFNMESQCEEVSPENSYVSEPVMEAMKAPSPEPPKELPVKIIQGKLAVCDYCGYLSEDFNKCMRCKRRLPENVKAIPAITTSGKKLDPRTLVLEKKLSLPKPNGTPKLNLLNKRRPVKPKLMECETVVVSSDDEDGEKKTPVRNVSEQLLEKLGNSVTISPISKEPSIVEIQKYSIAAAGPEKNLQEQQFSTVLNCRTVRVGSYRFVPPEQVRLSSSGLELKIPHPKNENIIKILKIDSSDIVKVLISFQKSLPVLFYYLLPSVGTIIRAALDMTLGSDFYFDPLSEVEEAHRRITLLPETLSEESKSVLHKIYQKSMDELTYKEANDILIKTCPKEMTKSVVNFANMNEIRQLMMYPPEGRGRISINTEDYMCLGLDQFLNDVIIDFYLKFLEQNLPKEQQEKVHIFSTFFYKRLTTKPLKASRKSQPTELDPNLTPAQKRHARVKTWTKNVNLFEKDFVVVPINENCHWFLAIICFPGMNGSHTIDGQAIKIEPKQHKKKKVATEADVNVPPSSLKEKKERAILCEDADLSDKDEAEGDDSELDSDDSEEAPPISVENNSNRPAIKQPCILIFDSLAGASRSRVVATLRDYLTCEYKAKMNVDKIFTKDVIKGACPKVPQQTNFTDCGLYLLQYVEHFFKDPIRDYYIPIQQLKTWFEEITVTKKREDISLLIKSLMTQYGKDLSLLPEVIFPTFNGDLIDRPIDEEDKFMDPDEEADEMDDEDEEYFPPGENERKPIDEENETDSNGPASESPMKPSCDSVNDKDDFLEHAVVNANMLKPDISELPRQSNKDTLSYLKAKRIIRHKNNSSSEGPDCKKAKICEPVTSA